MIARSNCNCLVCQLEKALVAELSDERAIEEYRLLAASSAVLSCFPNALQLVRHLHTQPTPNQHSSCDPILQELLHLNRQSEIASLWRQTLLLVFIPTIHRTTSQVATTFPSQARDDISQHALTTLLEFLTSRELLARHSHIAFTIARKLRRLMFRWAIHQSRTALPDDTEKAMAPLVSESDAPAPDVFQSGILLHRFLDGCQRAGWLSSGERELLIQCKLEGLTCQELAQRNGHSAVALRHRVQRVLAKLRRLADDHPGRVSEQLELFP